MTFDHETPVDRVFHRVQNDLNHLSTISDGERGVTRLAYSREDTTARQWFLSECESAGLQHEVDRAGNVFAWSPGSEGQSPLLLASHLDTVIEAGSYDGILGVTVGLEVVRELVRADPSVPVGVGVFGCEESTRFGLGTVGSRLLMEELTYGEAADLVDRFGLTFTQAVEAAGLSDFEPRTAEPDFISGLIEVHIDQGTLLATSDSRIGIVSTIAGVDRTALEWIGQASHSGGRRRSERRDALLAAAEFLVRLDEIWSGLEPETFVQMTVGQLDVEPNSPNTVPGAVRAVLDVRALEASVLDRAVSLALHSAEELATTREIKLTSKHLGRLEPVPMNRDLSDSLHAAAGRLNIGAPLVPSFAGHDAMIVAKHFPASMVLVSNPTGMSHTPEEAYDPEGLRQAITLVLDTVPAVLGQRAHR